jgi:hypothetical protein
VRAAAIFAAVCALLHSASAWAQASAVGVASATVVNPVAIRSVQGLDFGVMSVSNQSAGSVTVFPDASAVQYDGGVWQVCRAGCAKPHAAQFEVMGEASRSYSVTAPSSLEASSESAAEVLQIEAIRLKTTSRPGAGPSGRINIFGRDRFDLGGTLKVPAGAAAAHYQANLPVIIAYD